PCRRVLDLPTDSEMTRPADRAVVEHGLGFAPSGNFGEAEVDHSWRPARYPQHRGGAFCIRGHRLLGKHRLAMAQSCNGNRGLHAWRCTNRDRVNVVALDHLCPVAESLRYAGLAGKCGCAGLVGASDRHDLAASIESERW